MKIFNVFLATLSLSIGLFAMESKNKSEVTKQVSRPERTDKDTENLGTLGKLPDDAILIIVLQLLNQADPRKAYQDFVNLSKTNKYLNQLLNVASNEKGFVDKIRIIKTELLKPEEQRLSNFVGEYKKYKNLEEAAIDLVSVAWIENRVTNFDKMKLKKYLDKIIDILSQEYLQTYVDEIKVSKLLKIAQILIDKGGLMISQNDLEETGDFSSLYKSLKKHAFSLSKILLNNGAVIDSESQELIREDLWVKKFIEDYQKTKNQDVMQD